MQYKYTKYLVIITDNDPPRRSPFATRHGRCQRQFLLLDHSRTTHAGMYTVDGKTMSYRLMYIVDTRSLLRVQKNAQWSCACARSIVEVNGF